MVSLIKNPIRPKSLNPSGEGMVYPPQVPKVMTFFGGPSDVVALAPVARQLVEAGFSTVTVSSERGEENESLFDHFDLDLNHHFSQPGASPRNLRASHVLEILDPLLESESPDVLLVHGESGNALSAALAAQNRQISVAHVGSGFPSSSINRQLISKIARYHFASNPTEKDQLEEEGIAADAIQLSGSPAIESLEWSLGERDESSKWLSDIFARTEARRFFVLDLSINDSPEGALRAQLEVISDFVSKNTDSSLVLLIDPDSEGSGMIESVFENDSDRVIIGQAPNYPDRTQLISSAWFVIADSNQLTKDAVTLHKNLVLLGQPSAAIEIEGISHVGESPDQLLVELEALSKDDSRIDRLTGAENPFGDGNAARRIVRHLLDTLPISGNSTKAHHKF